MKYKTKHERLIAITEAYRTKTGKTTFTTREVAEWAERNSLIPIPKRGTHPELCEQWEEILAAASK